MPFDKYMEYCLYDMEKGYYIKSENIFGKDGDFYTPQIASSFFGKLIAELIGKKGFRKVYEFGAGSGYLALDIISSNSDIEEYIIFEISERMIRASNSKLECFKDKVKFYKSIDEISEIKGFCIMVEFVDSFPVKRFLKKGIFYEVWVDIEKKEEVFKKAENYDFLNYYEFLPDGYFFEYPFSFIKWLDGFSEKFRGGIVLLVDYGLEREDLISYPEGTIRGFKRHKIIKNLLDFSPGEIDITYTPDFSLLKKVFEDRGFNIKKFSSLSKFLIDEGILEIFEKEVSGNLPLSIKIKKQSELKTLITPGIMGEKYVVLILERDER